MRYVGVFPWYELLRGERYVEDKVADIHFAPDSVTIEYLDNAALEEALKLARERAEFIGVPFPDVYAYRVTGYGWKLWNP